MLAVLTTHMETNSCDSHVGLDVTEREVVSYSGNVDDAFLDLLDELFCAAEEGYAATVLDWFATDPSQPLKMLNGSCLFETWHWSAD